ncbi:uncharacterized protein K452DRAFT_326348 [Aplosporella prunicola CBS 121167]|uniref:Pre-rrna processing protein n=1 Tax=Aplosporella prunicola CBS 121167 TaxID=1176127 RepID=A0A6A6BGJ8_9PEZI|nr:uncharacterized protein K452DRAFT_326348 [Aplosporella prunicola CBS 121167]KAF2142445.1 hypothetical protein K452DRAFT_326348 [Aplosporella prunicola CBS 121167]
MADTPWGSTATPSPRPASPTHTPSKSSTRDSPHPEDDLTTTEETPLLSPDEREDDDDEDANDRPSRSQAVWSLLHSLGGRRSAAAEEHRGKLKRRWPSVIALLLLCAAVVIIMILGFLVPEAVQEYTNQAVVFQPTGLRFESFNPDGVAVRVEGDFTMDASKVQRKSVRDFGRFGTWIAKEVESGESSVEVALPDYGNAVIGTAIIPPIKVSIRNGRTTHIKLVANLHPGSMDGVRDIANDWITGKLGALRLQGKANVPLKSGIIHLGTQKIEEALVFEGNAIPALPEYKIARLNVHEVDLPGTGTGMAADVSLVVVNDYPLDIMIPPLGFGILVGNCMPSDPYIMVADAETSFLHIAPYRDLELNVSGIVRQLPEALTTACPGSKKSPLDLLVGDYIHGDDTTIYVRGSDSPSLDTPKWITDLMADITVPVPFPGRTFEGLVRNFSLTDVHFHLPGFFAEPDSPEARPRISAKIKALVGLPEEMNFPLAVDRVRAETDVFYKDKKLGNLDLSKWQAANSTRTEAHDDDAPGLLVESEVKEAPLEITDEDVFSEVVQALLFGNKTVMLSVKADVDVEMATSLGMFKVRRIPAQGVVPVKRKDGGKGGLAHLAPKVGGLRILDTTESSLTLEALVNFTNPTDYSATVPYADINLLTNGTVLGHVTARDIKVKPGNNTNVVVQAVWDPLSASGEEGRAVGRELLSQYISGFNTTLTLRTHANTIPAQPALGRALADLPLKLPTPRLHNPSSGDDDDDNDSPDDKAPHFIRSATMHLLTSTATFTLLSPLSTTTLYITHLNATAYYHSHPVGRIVHDCTFPVPPGGPATSPRLPVQWSIGGVGYDAVKRALGGRLKLGAKAEVGVRVGRWEEEVWFLGKGIGAGIRL